MSRAAAWKRQSDHDFQHAQTSLARGEYVGSPPLRAIRARRRQDVIDGLRTALRDHPPGPDVVAVLLFGSWARGDFDGLSDIDLLVLTDGPAQLFDSTDLPDAARLDIAQVPAMDHLTHAAAGHPFHAKVAAEAVVLWQWQSHLQP